MRNKIALVIAVVLGVIAIYGIYRFLERREAEISKKHRTVPVACARQRIPVGTRIAPDMLSAKGREIDEGSITEDHILFRYREQLIGWQVNKDVQRGQPLLRSYFTKPPEKLEAKLGHGERALALRVDAISGVAGNIVPGSHVDIICTFIEKTPAAQRAKSAASQTTRTLLLLSNVTILAVDNRISDAQYGVMPGTATRQGYGSVTVAVSPSEAGLLTYVQKVADITLALRLKTDKTIGDQDPAKPSQDVPPPEINDETWPKIADQLRGSRAARVKKGSAITVQPRK